jgi:Fe-S oxidoreductase
VALLTGCAQKVIAPSINAATIRLLNRHGVEVVVPPAAGCCGAIVHHMGKAEQARAMAIDTIRAWTEEAEARGLDAIVVNTSGCGTEIKDYGHIFRDDPAWAAPAARVSALTGHDRRLPRRLLSAARPESDRRAQGAAGGGGLHGQGRARGPPLLRLGRHL